MEWITHWIFFCVCSFITAYEIYLANVKRDEKRGFVYIHKDFDGCESRFPFFSKSPLRSGIGYSIPSSNSLIEVRR